MEILRQVNQTKKIASKMLAIRPTPFMGQGYSCLPKLARFTGGVKLGKWGIEKGGGAGLYGQKGLVARTPAPVEGVGRWAISRRGSWVTSPRMSRCA